MPDAVGLQARLLAPPPLGDCTLHAQLRRPRLGAQGAFNGVAAELLWVATQLLSLSPSLTLAYVTSLITPRKSNADLNGPQHAAREAS